MQPADRIIKKCHEHQDPDQIAQLQAAGQNSVTTKAQHEQRTDCFEHRHRRRVNRPRPHHHQRGVPQLIAGAIEARVFLAFAREAFDLTNPGKIVVQQRVDIRCSAPL